MSRVFATRDTSAVWMLNARLSTNGAAEIAVIINPLMNNFLSRRTPHVVPGIALCLLCASCSNTNSGGNSDSHSGGDRAAQTENRERIVVVARPTPTPIPARLPIPRWARAHVILKVPVKPGQKVFALTFDDGPWPQYTRQILRILKDEKVPASFFMVGQEVSRRPEIAREVSLAGHAIGNHSWDHPSRPRDAVAQVTRTNAAIKKAVGFAPTFFRPPYGILKNGMARQAMNQGQPVIIWSADGADWKKPGAEKMARRIINEASPGGIALMHDGGGNRNQTVAALPKIIRELRARGYRFVTLPELLQMRHVAPVKPKAAKKPVPKGAAKPLTNAVKTGR